MNIIEAAKAMDQEKYVKRKRWPDGVSCRALFPYDVIVSGKKDIDPESFEFTVSDLLADDWEIVE